MTIEKAIQWFEARNKATTMPGARAMTEMALTALRAQQEQEDPKPLTLDELQKMDGEPVWVVWPNRGIRGQWFVVGSYDWRRMEDDNMILDSRYGKSNVWNAWIAYRHKPKEV